MNEFLEHFQEDYCRQLHNGVGNCVRCIEHALRDVQQIMEQHYVDPRAYGLPLPSNDLPIIRQQTTSAEDYEIATEMQQTFNNEQRNAFREIIAATNSRGAVPKCFFLDGPGGSGKTYLYTALTHYLRGEGRVVVAAATTGIAANLLLDGGTMHSTFKLVLQNNETTKSNLSARLHMWRLKYRPYHFRRVHDGILSSG